MASIGSLAYSSLGDKPFVRVLVGSSSALGDKPFTRGLVGRSSSLGDRPYIHRQASSPPDSPSVLQSLSLVQNLIPHAIRRARSRHAHQSTKLESTTAEAKFLPPSSLTLAVEHSDLTPFQLHASGELPEFVEPAVIIACEPWRQTSPNSNRSDAGLPVGTFAAVISGLQIVPENDIGGGQLNLGALAICGSGEHGDQNKPAVVSTVKTTNIIEGNTKLEESATDAPGIQVVPRDADIKSYLWTLPDPNYRAIKSWDTVSLDHQAIKNQDEISPDYRGVKSWASTLEDNHAKAFGDTSPKTASYSHNCGIKFSIPSAKAPLKPKVTLGTPSSDSPHPTPVSLSSKLTTQVPPKTKTKTAAIQSLIAPESKDIQTAGSYVIPPAFDPFKYGRPSTTRVDSSPIVNGGYSRPIYGYSLDTEKRATSKEPRSIVIKNLPENPTFAMVSLICKNTGKIETITLFESLKKARVVFVHSADADNFFNEAGGGSSFEYYLGQTKIQHSVKIEMRYNVNFLSTPTHTLVTKKKATRVVRIVGCDREGLEYLVDSKEDQNESLEELLLKLAGLYAYSGVESRVEGATWRNTDKGLLEANLIYSRIKDACCAIVALGKETELGRCTITYGKDP